MQPFDNIDFDQLAKEELANGNLKNVLNNLKEHFSNMHSNYKKPDSFEKHWLKTMKNQLNYQKNESVLDLGSGYAELTRLFKEINLFCLEPQKSCCEFLKSKKIKCFNSEFLETKFKQKFDHVLSCRSLGVVSLDQKRQIHLKEALLKMHKLANKSVTIIMRNFRYYLKEEAQIRGLLKHSFLKEPYLYPIPILFQLGITPNLNWFNFQKTVIYQDINSLLLEEMPKEDNLELKNFLINDSIRLNDGRIKRTIFYRNYILSWES